MEINQEYEEINPSVWKPENEDDKVEGRYVRKETDKGINDSNAYYLDSLDGKQVLVWGSAIIDDRMAFANIGDWIRLTYKGTTKNKKNQDVKLFKVERKTPDKDSTTID